LSLAFPALPIGGDWLHEIKHDGFRIMARRDAAGVRLLTRNGHDFAGRFPMAAAAVATLPARSCLIDGEAIVTDQNGLAVFDLIRAHRRSTAAVLCAFDLLELDGEDLRREPIETRKSTLKSLLRGKYVGIAFNAHTSRGWRNRLPAGARLRGHRIEAPRVAVPFRPGRLLDQGQESGGAGGEARGRGGVELKGTQSAGRRALKNLRSQRGNVVSSN
jgi:bifunctional non-homologous end joining protein LigD